MIRKFLIDNLRDGAQLGENLLVKLGVKQPQPVLDRDSSQICINVSATLRPEDFGFNGFTATLLKSKEEKTLRLFSGAEMDVELRKHFTDGYRMVRLAQSRQRNFKIDIDSKGHAPSFRPERVVISQSVIATYAGANLPDMRATSEHSAPSDILLTGFFSGGENSFPNAPSSEGGIHGGALAANAFGIGLLWPVIRIGVPVTAHFAIMPSVLGRVPPPPEGYNKNPESVDVSIFLSIFGPQI